MIVRVYRETTRWESTLTDWRQVWRGEWDGSTLSPVPCQLAPMATDLRDRLAAGDRFGWLDEWHGFTAEPDPSDAELLGIPEDATHDAVRDAQRRACERIRQAAERITRQLAPPDLRHNPDLDDVFS